MKKFIGIFFVFAMMLSCMTACVENPESETAVYAARTERAGTDTSPVVIEYDSLDRKIKETCFYFDGSINFYTIIEYYPGTDTTKKKTSYRSDNTIFAIEDYDNSVELSKEETDLIKRNVLQSVTKDFAGALLKSYADEYKIRVKYKLMGLTDL